MTTKRLIRMATLFAALTLVALLAYYYTSIYFLQRYGASVDSFPTVVVNTDPKTSYIPENDLKPGDKVKLDRPMNNQVSVLVYNLSSDCNTFRPIMGMAREMPSVTFLVYYLHADSCTNDPTPLIKNLLILHDSNRKIWHQLKVQWYPRVYVINAEGRIAYVQSISEDLTDALLTAKSIAQSLQNK